MLITVAIYYNLPISPTDEPQAQAPKVSESITRILLDRNLPEKLVGILREIATCRHATSPYRNDLLLLENQWGMRAERIGSTYPFLTVESHGETIYYGQMSPGCQACKKGLWDCIFLTSDCNLSCDFCCSPLQQGSRKDLFSAFGSCYREIAANYLKAGVKGIAFTGGEVFTVFKTLLSGVDYFKREIPGSYLWLYTNGTLIERGQLKLLHDAGLDEIRFNTAATGYTDQKMLAVMQHCARLGIKVTVEIPAIPADGEKLINSLNAWVNCGATSLNLHELMGVEGSRSARFPGEFRMLPLCDGPITRIEENSRELVLRILLHTYNLKIPLSVNDCSIQNKMRQIRKRRQAMARLAGKRHEPLDQEGLLLVHFAWQKNGQLFEPGRNNIATIRVTSDWNYLVVKQRPPLTVGGRWNSISVVEGRIDGKEISPFPQ